MIDGRRGVFYAVALAVVALVIAVCLTSSIEASPSVHHECSALTSGQTALCKPVALAPSFSAVTVDARTPIEPPPISSGELPAPSQKPPPAAVLRGLGSRSPPASPSSRSI